VSTAAAKKMRKISRARKEEFIGKMEREKIQMRIKRSNTELNAIQTEAVNICTPHTPS
jgi:hypothetical protein